MGRLENKPHGLKQDIFHVKKTTIEYLPMCVVCMLTRLLKKNNQKVNQLETH